MLCSPLTTWLLVTISPFASIITPEPICCPWAVVTASSTTDGSIFAIAASCCVITVLLLDDAAGDFDVVPVVPLLPLYAYSQPAANRARPKMMARTRMIITKRAVRPGRFRGGIGDIGEFGAGNGPEGWLSS